MNLEHSFQFPLPNGLHARPASCLQEVTNRFAAEITLRNNRTGRTADAKSVLALIGADVKEGDPCRLEFSGADCAAALEAVRAYLQTEFIKSDEALPQIAAPESELPLPRTLRSAGLEQFHRGQALSRGIGWGNVVLLGSLALPRGVQSGKAADAGSECQTVQRGISSLSEQTRTKIEHSTNPQEAMVLKAHLAMVQDRAFVSKIEELIFNGGLTAGQAILAAAESFSEVLRNAESQYLRERVVDIEDFCGQLLGIVYGTEAGAASPALDGPSICVAGDLTPGHFLGLDRSRLQALVLGHAGTTSHTVILARSFGIPTLVGLPDAQRLFREGQEIIVDANLGIIIPEVTAPVARYYRRALENAARLQDKHNAFRGCEGRTLDGRRVEIAANVASAEEAKAGFAAGAEGIGLFRTEMLFMDREAPPGEDEQAAIYTAAAQAGGGRPVIIRTLDIGGDKPVSYLGLPKETNPFLGYRGVRIYKEFSALAKTQFRAILRAAEHHPVRMMVPMVACIEEVRFVKALLAEARAELRDTGSTAADAAIEFGVMLEIPSVAFEMPQLCREVDFFSIGTNDLTQYFLAADRDNAKVASLYSARHPAFLRLLKMLVDEAHAGGKWIGLCGEMGEDAGLMPLLIGLGIDEISLSVPRIAAAKALVCKAEFHRCVELVTRVLSSATREEVAAHLNAFGDTHPSVPFLTPELVVLESDAVSKEEAIQELVSALHLSGRTERPECVEEEIWTRELTYSTGFGGGFAIPHCKSAHLAANSIVILKTRDGSPGIEWGSLDGNPVRVAVLLAIRGDDAGKEHLKILATLSRQVMRDEFRERLMNESDPVALARFVMSGLPVA